MQAGNAGVLSGVGLFGMAVRWIDDYEDSQISKLEGASSLRPVIDQ